jgi:hypothetical protein
MTYSTEYRVIGMGLIIATTLTFFSWEAFIPTSFLALPFTIIWKYILGFFIFWFIAFYVLAYKLKPKE